MKALIIIFVVLGLTSCMSNQPVKKSQAKMPLTKTEQIAFWADLSCSLLAISDAPSAIDKLAFNNKIGINKKRKKDRLKNVKNISSHEYLERSYAACMNKAKLKRPNLPAQHMQELKTLDRCFLKLDVNTYVLIDAMLGTRKNKVLTNYLRYNSKSDKTLVTNYFNQAYVMLNSAKSIEESMDKIQIDLFRCKSNNQTIFSKISPVNLHRAVQNAIKNRKS